MTDSGIVQRRRMNIKYLFLFIPDSTFNYHHGLYHHSATTQGLTMLYREVVVDIRTRSMFGHQQVRFIGDWRVYANECIGGWWTRPANWAANTAIASVGIIAITYGIWRVSASLEVCSVLPQIKRCFYKCSLLKRQERYNPIGQYLQC
jgi:hypothetical protein